MYLLCHQLKVFEIWHWFLFVQKRNFTLLSVSSSNCIELFVSLVIESYLKSTKGQLREDLINSFSDLLEHDDADSRHGACRALTILNVIFYHIFWNNNIFSPNSNEYDNNVDYYDAYVVSITDQISSMTFL